MYKYIKVVLLVFSSGLSAYIYPDSITNISIDKITDSITLSDNYSFKDKTAGKLILWIANSADTNDCYQDNKENESRTLFDRVLAKNDIAQIHILFEDDSIEWFFTNREDDGYGNNSLQSSLIAEDGELEITIGR